MAKEKAQKTEKKGKGEKKGKPAYRVSKIYEVSGDSLKRKNQYCPKCGPGTFLANHSNRSSCGKCGYAEMKKA
ncbi:30S ribosomal protein S27ae [Candidatus Woesearchaeota archaeon]|nr:30S ribosomal protein S27ae [Candidatus Woesearchaeota archaeon]